MKSNLVAILAMPMLLSSNVLAQTAPPAIKFNRDIRPLLSENCFACHGPDQKNRKGKLRLDTKDGLYSKKDDVTIVVPGKSSESELFRRLTTTDADDHMPPAKSGKQLTPEQIELMRRWINSGAEWQGHWAFIPPERPPVPTVKDEQWARNEVDRFILAKLESVGLKPSGEADKTHLIRRLSFDLTGLPPALEEIDAFLADTSPQAYDKLVDHYLSSPHYGERMALHWLDLARYADTHGYHLDSGRDMWKWREWVIEAYNRNEPYDQFVVEQLAGDLLPGATVEQKLATGFNRNSMINFEGGAIPQEYLTQYIIDRANTTSTVFLGLTMGCAQCHDHKFDPITQKDYYRFFAYFNAVPENGLDGSRGNAEPLLYLPNAAQEAKWKKLDEELQAAEKRQQEVLPEVDAAQVQWEGEQRNRFSIPWSVVDVKNLRSEGGSTLTRQEDGSVLAGGKNPEKDIYEVIAGTDQSSITAVKLEVLTDASLPAKGPGRADNSNLVLDEFELELAPGSSAEKAEPVKFVSATADYSQKGFNIKRAIDGDRSTGWALDGPTRHENATAIFVCEKAMSLTNGADMRFRMHFNSYAQHGIGRFRLSVTSSPWAQKELPPKEIEQILAKVAEQRTDAEKATIQKYYRENISTLYKERGKAIASARKSLDEVKKTVPTSMVMAQMEKPRDTFILTRGQYNQPGEKVTPGVPESLPPLPADAPANRLGLARWLVSSSNPLTARVTVNRLWGIVMGTGIVKTANDFGSQAEWPTHPALLDWLATEFMQSGWDVKHMMKLIVSSSAYRQATAVTPELLEKDPDNRLYARGPRFRLSAEAIRDNALAVSGLLVGTMGGPSVFPYQPPGLWEELSSRQDSKNWTAQSYTPSHGPDLYRRSMYTFWKRTSPPPSLQAFDAPDRETCVVQRDRTSTPLQALVTLNDPTYVEAARKLAERMINEGGATPEKRVAFAFRLATARKPSEAETGILVDLYQKQLKRFQNKTEDAGKLLKEGESPRNETLNADELAAWTSVAGMILNLDETITKG